MKVNILLALVITVQPFNCKEALNKHLHIQEEKRVEFIGSMCEVSPPFAHRHMLSYLTYANSPEVPFDWLKTQRC